MINCHFADFHIRSLALMSHSLLLALVQLLLRLLALVQLLLLRRLLILPKIQFVLPLKGVISFRFSGFLSKLAASSICGVLKCIALLLLVWCFPTGQFEVVRRMPLLRQPSSLFQIFQSFQSDTPYQLIPLETPLIPKFRKNHLVSVCESIWYENQWAIPNLRSDSSFLLCFPSSYVQGTIPMLMVVLLLTFVLVVCYFFFVYITSQALIYCPY